MFLFPKERLLEIARVAEEHHVFTDMSEILLKKCTSAIVESPEDYNELVTEWSKKSPEERSVALRLLARVDHQKIAVNIDTNRQAQEVISHVHNIKRLIKPRSRLQKIETALSNSWGQSKQQIIDRIDKHGSNGDVFFSQPLGVPKKGC